MVSVWVGLNIGGLELNLDIERKLAFVDFKFFNFIPMKRLILYTRHYHEEYAKQQQQISKIIENNLVITKQEIGKLQEEINDLKKSIEFTENVLEEKVAKLSRTFASCKKNLRKLRKM